MGYVLYTFANNIQVLANTEKNNNREIIKTWLTGHHSCTLIIPKDFAKQYDLDEPSHVIVEGTAEGILIRKLKI
ncbi:MAG: AbrB/MazE/SpoVT family DNA-binding domain-containing protein [Candidatus Nitrosocosmicus sp.]|nr:AbrB/MazE/SpoVT family DNA-binding domain-containing protein [Candidatus Nitrosocosmicus sp.]